jgi:hypothetical protein
MPLLDLKTNLKSLRYGKDRPGGGDSGQPFIQTSDQDSFDLATADLGISGGTDYLLRGGALTLERSSQDVSRLSKWGLSGTPPGILGLLFTAKQESLSLQGQLIGAGGPKNTPVSGEGIYLPTSTLAQAGVNAFGLHGNKQGVNPFPINDSFSIFGREISIPGAGALGRPTYLRNYINNASHPALEPENNRLVYLSKEVPYNDSGLLFSYNGGPGAVGGVIGKTNIHFSAGNRVGLGNPDLAGSPGQTAKFLSPSVRNTGFEHYDYGVFKNPRPTITQGAKIFSTGASNVYNRLVKKTNTKASLVVLAGYKRDNNQGALRDFANNVYTQGNTFPDVDRAIQGANGAATFTQKQLINALPISQGGQIQDFRKSVTTNASIAKATGMLIKAPNYQLKNIDARLNYNDPGSKVRNRSSYTRGSGIVDAINGLYMYNANNVTADSVKNDLVKFRFAVIDPDDPSQKTFVHFRSFFNGAITDNMGANWDSFRYQGRGEEFFHYGGFTRNMSFGFTVPAQSKEELSVMYQKLNYLQSTLAPNYSAAGYMRGNIHQLTIGGYLYETPGVITSLNYTMPENSTWEIGINDAGGFDPSVKELAHRIEVQVNFKPIHNFLPETIKSGNIDSSGDIKPRFISLASGAGNTKNDNLYARGINPDRIPPPDPITTPPAENSTQSTPTDTFLTPFTSTGGSGMGGIDRGDREFEALLNQNR